MNILIAVAQDHTGRPDTLDANRCAVVVRDALDGRGYSCEILFVGVHAFDRLSDLRKNILRRKPDCIVNLFEGFGDDSEKEIEFARVLEDTGIPFTGNSSYTLGLCLDKYAMKEALKRCDVPVPSGFTVNSRADLIQTYPHPPLFIKPRLEHGSVGIDRDSLVESESRLTQVLEGKLTLFKKGLLVEEFIPGKEYSVSFLGDEPYELVGVSCLEYGKMGFPAFLTYDSKWDALSQEYHVHMPSVSTDMEYGIFNNLVRTAKKAGAAVLCRSYFRVDIRVRDGTCYVLDVNPNPDVNEDSGFMRQAYQRHLSLYDTFVKIIGYSLTGRNACLQIKE